MDYWDQPLAAMCATETSPGAWVAFRGDHPDSAPLLSGSSTTRLGCASCQGDASVDGITIRAILTIRHAPNCLDALRWAALFAEHLPELLGGG